MTNYDEKTPEEQIFTQENEYINDIEGSEEGELLLDKNEGISLEKNDRSLAEFHRWHKNGRLVLDPEWQREYLWDRKRASKLIESFLKDVPVPVIYLAKNSENKYEVIDGLQRLTSVFDFIDNKYKLRGLELIEDYNGKFYRDLPSEIQNQLYDTTVRTFELSKKTSKDMMFIIFERLNTGGIALNDMEIRNCLYRGKLNSLIKQLALNSDFLKCVNQKNLSKRMKNRSLILRFLAFYEKTYHKANRGLKRFLNEFFDYYKNPDEVKLKEYENQFRKSMKAALTVFGDKGFRLRQDGGEWSSRINATVFQVLSVSFTKYDIGQLTRNADAIYEEYVDLVSNDEQWVDKVRRATGEIQRLTYVFETWNSRLNELMKETEPNDSKRVFSAGLKKQMWDQNRTCSICGQEIKLLIDAVLDHDKHYWRGGKTIPQNARLVHRHCNLARSDKETTSD